MRKQRLVPINNAGFKLEQNGCMATEYRGMGLKITLLCFASTVFHEVNRVTLSSAVSQQKIVAQVEFRGLDTCLGTNELPNPNLSL